MKLDEIMLAVLVILSFTAVLEFFFTRRTRSAWSGSVEDKYPDDGAGTSDYCVVFRTDLGKNVKIRVLPEMFREYQKGDRVQKRNGSDFPNEDTLIR